jgi:hypothetical protein
MTINLLYVGIAILAVIIGKHALNFVPTWSAWRRSMDPNIMWWLNTRGIEPQFQRVRVQERRCPEAARIATRSDIIDGPARY